MVHSYVTVSGVSGSTRANGRASTKFGRTLQTDRTITKRQWRVARALFFILAFLLLFTGFSFMHTSASTKQILSSSIEEQVITVDSGDTLWQLANTYKKDSMDTREAVHYMLKRNALTSSELKLGQTLIIPARISR